MRRFLKHAFISGYCYGLLPARVVALAFQVFRLSSV
jgi:hypothetical protein